MCCTLTTNFQINYDTSLAYNIYTLLCAVNLTIMINRIYKKLEKFGVIADVDLEVIGEDIEFDFIEYTNFISINYKPWAGDWVRISDDKMIYNPIEILNDFVDSRNA